MMNANHQRFDFNSQRFGNVAWHTGTRERQGLEWRGLGKLDHGFTTVIVSGAEGCRNGGMQDPGSALPGTLECEHAGMLERRKPAIGKHGALGYWQDGMQEHRVSGAAGSAVWGCVDCWRAGMMNARIAGNVLSSTRDHRNAGGQACGRAARWT
eukprot:gene17601-biopygen10267